MVSRKGGKLERSSEIIGGITWLVMIVFIIYMAIMSSKADKRSKELKLHEKEDARQAKMAAIQAEIDVANQAFQALPDITSALNLLREKYGWREILETIRVHALKLQLLREISFEESVSLNLPNMQADRYNGEEWRVVREARKVNYQFRDEVTTYGIDALAQEPTVQMLRELVDSGYVSTVEPFTTKTRSYTCSLTESGKSLVALDAQFCRGDTAKAYLRRAPSAEVQELIATVLYRGIRQLNEQGEVTPKG